MLGALVVRYRLIRCHLSSLKTPHLPPLPPQQGAKLRIASLTVGDYPSSLKLLLLTAASNALKRLVNGDCERCGEARPMIRPVLQPINPSFVHIGVKEAYYYHLSRRSVCQVPTALIFHVVLLPSTLYLHHPIRIWTTYISPVRPTRKKKVQRLRVFHYYCR